MFSSKLKNTSSVDIWSWKGDMDIKAVIPFPSKYDKGKALMDHVQNCAVTFFHIMAQNYTVRSIDETVRTKYIHIFTRVAKGLRNIDTGIYFVNYTESKTLYHSVRFLCREKSRVDLAQVF